MPNTVFNGGAWLRIDGRASDVHYRDLEVIYRVIAEANEGRFETEPLWFHLSGLPSYLVLAELAAKRVLVGELPEIAEFPPALREHAPGGWWEQGEAELDCGRRYHAASGRLTQCLGLLARAVTCTAHAVLAARGIWVTNEKQLFARSGLGEVDSVLATATPEPAALRIVVDTTEAFCAEAIRSARSHR